MAESRVITLWTILVFFALSRPRDQDAWERKQFDENENETIKFYLENLTSPYNVVEYLNNFFTTITDIDVTFQHAELSMHKFSCILNINDY